MLRFFYKNLMEALNSRITALAVMLETVRPEELTRLQGALNALRQFQKEAEQLYVRITREEEI